LQLLGKGEGKKRDDDDKEIKVEMSLCFCNLPGSRAKAPVSFCAAQ